MKISKHTLDDYKDVFTAAVSSTEDFANSNPLRFSNDPDQHNKIIQIALLHPDWFSSNILDWFKNKRDITIKFNVGQFLKKYRILKPEERIEVTHYINHHFQNLDTLLYSDDDEMSKSVFHNFVNDRRRLRKSWPIIARMILIRLADSMKKESSAELKSLGDRISKVLRRVLLPRSSVLFDDILFNVARTRSIIENETVNEKLSGIIETVRELEEEEEYSESENKDLQTLTDENADLKSTLFGLKHELTILQEQIQMMQESARTQAIIQFLGELNSPQNGFLLDNLAQSTKVVNDLIDQGWMPEPPETEGVIYSIKMVIEYLQKVGVTPIRSIGEHTNVTIEELSYIHYAGSEFQTRTEYKSVEFRSTGWQYKGEIISKPQAIEIDDRY